MAKQESAPTMGPARVRSGRARGDSERSRFQRDVLAGLERSPRAIPPVWFYDAAGSRLFQRIMRLPGYYPTRVETEILQTHGDALVDALASGPSSVVDLGAGDGAKTKLLVAAALRRSSSVVYAPVDVAATALRAATRQMRASWPGLEVRPQRGGYVDGLARASAGSGRAPLLALLLGSNIGNLEWQEAIALLTALRKALRPRDHLLIGFDLLKKVELLRGAYDDPDGVTAAFNLNLLTRINRELQGDFAEGAFEHRATFDARRPAMESWLVARKALTVRVAGRSFTFRAGEVIHTEISWKYTSAQITQLALAAGFREVARFHDARQWFADALWCVEPEGA